MRSLCHSSLAIVILEKGATTVLLKLLSYRLSNFYL